MNVIRIAATIKHIQKKNGSIIISISITASSHKDKIMCTKRKQRKRKKEKKSREKRENRENMQKRNITTIATDIFTMD